MIIGKIRKPYPYKLYSLPDGGFVWKAAVSIPSYIQPTDYDADDFDFSDVNQTAVVIGNVYIDGIRYTSQITEAECRAIEKSWHFDDSAQELFIHIDHTKRLDGSDFDTAQIFGHSSETVFYDEDDNEYLPFIASNLKVVEEADRLVYNKITFPEQTLKLDNRNGDFDDFYDNPTPGSDVEYKYIPSEDVYNGKNSLIDIYVGYVNDDELSRDDYSLTVKDKRAQLSDTWPQATFTIDDYPNIENDIAGDIIPDGYGVVEDFYIPAICVNGTLTTGDVEYRYAIESFKLYTTYEAGKLYVDIDDVWTEVTATFDHITGSVSTSDTNARDSSGKVRDAKVINVGLHGDGTVFASLKYILDLAGFPYNSEKWDTAKAEEEAAEYLTASTFFYMGEEKELYEYIEELQGGGEYGVRLNYGADRRWSIQCDDIHRAVVAEYKAIDNVSDVVTVPRDLTEYATSVEVEYAYNVYDDSYSSVIDDSRKVDIFNIYRVYQAKTFTSMLIGETAATERADIIAEDYAVARGQISFTLNWIQPHLIYDVVTIDTSVYNKGVKIREYLGVRKIKISRIEYDFNNETTTLTGYDISEVE